MADTVGMTLVLRADAKGVVAEMKNAQGAVIDTARIMRSQLKSAADAGASSMEKLKTSMGRSRETAMFFTQSLSEFGPAGRTAQMAMSSLGSMMLGGGLLGAGLIAAQAAVRLLTQSWEEEAAASKKAADEAKRAGEEIRKATAAAIDATAALNLKNAGGTGAMEFMRSGVMPVRVALQAAKAGEAAAQADLEAWTQNIESGDFAMRTVAPTIEAAKQAVATTSAQVAALQGQLTALTQQAESMVQSETLGAVKKKTPEQIAADQQKATNEYMARINAQLQADIEAANERGRLMLMEQELEQNRVKRLADAAEQVKSQWQAAGSVISGAFSELGTIIGGAASSWMSYFGQLIQKAIQLAIALSATSGPWGWLNSAAAGLALVSAVTSVPEFRAMGGEVGANKPYIVGERGPELFVPGQSGGIVPNHAMGGGGVVINISATDAKGVRRLLLDNQPALAEAIGQAIRDGRRFS